MFFVFRQLKKILCDLFDVEKGGQTAGYAIKKVNEFLTELGISLEALECYYYWWSSSNEVCFSKYKETYYLWMSSLIYCVQT